jgi:colicin import membrane protein
MSLATAARSDVDRILADRERRAGRGLNGASVAAAVGLHGLAVAIALLLPHLQPPPKQLEFVPVTVIPAQALGVRRPAPPKKSAPKPAETPAAEAPEEAAKPEPAKPEPPKVEPKSEAPVLPEKTDKKKPEPPKPAAKPETSTPGGKKPETGKSAATAPAGPGNPNGKPNSPPNATAVGETGDQAGRRGAPTGSPLGTTAFGSQIAGLDNPDFTYGYYLDRLLSLIDANWVRPSMGSGVRAIVSFRIQRDGSLADLRISESSGYNSFDLAALRAVQNAAPFPPLPRPYRGDDLGVNLVVY